MPDLFRNDVWKPAITTFFKELRLIFFCHALTLRDLVMPYGDSSFEDTKASHGLTLTSHQ